MVNLPVETNDPEKGIIISDGRGMQADSIPMVSIIPGYPISEITLIIHWAMGRNIDSNIIPAF
jgi:hypothetical protein